MKITSYRTPVEHIVIDDFFPLDEHGKFLSECESVIKKSSDVDKSALDDDGNVLRKGHCCFLDRLFLDRSESYILSNFRKYLYSEKISSTIFDIDTMLQYWTLTNSDWSMVSYYENSDYYKPHKDMSLFTSLIWLNKDPQEFTGGDLTFTTHQHTIEYKNNRCVIFPSVTTHEVSEIKMKEGGSNGRYCISVFTMIDFYRV